MADLTARLSTAIADRYRIERHLGQGGMAIVYLALDVKHNRKVALKVLRPELAAVIGAERFLKEIEVTANLQHPHILPLHDSGEADTFLYYVMPYVEGETLRDKLAREKQLAVDTAIEITRAVAGALDYAHRQGVIHRDIKPENILLHDGQPLIADFGIALAVSAAGGTRLTETGLSLGTPHYMSPEQAMGDRELDARSDVYSLGAMLYEMLAGDPPYTGSTAQAIVAKVITEKAQPVTLHRDTVPPHVAAALAKALSKLPADRFASAAQFAEAISRPGLLPALPDTQVHAASAYLHTWWRRLVPVGLVTAGLAVGAALAWLGLRGRGAELPVVRFTLDLADNLAPRNRTWGAAPVAVAPDGRAIAFEAEGKIYLRPVDRLAAAPLPSTDGGYAPFFSPDGTWLGFFAQGQLRKVPVAGGPAIALADTGIGICSSGSWGTDGTIVFSAAAAITSPTTACTISTLFRISAAGGGREMLVPDTGLYRSYYPNLLPNGRGVVFTRCSADCAEHALMVLDLRTGQVRELVRDATMGFYVRGGFLVFVQAPGSMNGAPFDPDRLELSGAPVSLLDGIYTAAYEGAQVNVSAGGALAYVPGSARNAMRLVLVGRDGRETPLDIPEGAYFEPRFSPDGRRIAVGVQSQNEYHVGIVDRASGTFSRLTSGVAATQPAWSADGRRVAYSARDSSGRWQIFWQPADGSALPEALAPALRSVRAWDLAFSPDGRWLAAAGNPRGTDKDVFGIPLGGDRQPVPLLATSTNESDPAISPDSRWMAYESNEAGQTQVYARPFPGPGGRYLVSQSGAGDPKWGATSRELIYWGTPSAGLTTARLEQGDALQAVTVQLQPFAVTARQVLFPAAPYVSDFDVTRDGRTIVAVRAQEATRAAPVVVLNWNAEVRRRFEELARK